MQVFIVSACLAGVRCRYDGESNEIPGIRKMVEEGKAIAVCPELLGGLSKPRPCCELIQQENGTIQVLNKESEDQTAEFQSGAHKT
ncbi:MAG: DUF523 domain-containing protein, partial [Bacteroidota bacterium]|nr:DUF523 domain-containing protein [Bacteroidota bacterium]